MWNKEVSTWWCLRLPTMRISHSDDDDEEDENEKAEIDEARADTFTLKSHLDTLEALKPTHFWGCVVQTHAGSCTACPFPWSHSNRHGKAARKQAEAWGGFSVASRFGWKEGSWDLPRFLICQLRGFCIGNDSIANSGMVPCTFWFPRFSQAFVIHTLGKSIIMWLCPPKPLSFLQWWVLFVRWLKLLAMNHEVLRSKVSANLTLSQHLIR